jgi:anti-anti-sigma regulatory factor
VTAQSASAPGVAPGRNPAFTVGLDLIAGRLKVAGPLDRDTTHLFHDAIMTLLACDRARWTVDLTELTACGRTGAHAIAGAYRWALRHNRRIVLVGTPVWLQQKLTRLLHHHRSLSGDQGVVAAAGVATADAAPERHPPPLRPESDIPSDREPRAEGSPQAPLYTASVNRAGGTITVGGHLDRVGADLLGGTVGALRRLGHRRIHVLLRPGATVDADGRGVLTALVQRMSADGVELTVS